MTKRILSLVLAALMLLSLAACTGGAGGTAATGGDKTASTPQERVKAGDPVTLSFYPHNTLAQPSGIYEGCIADWLLDTYNIKIDAWAFSPERTTTILSSGALADITYVTSVVDLNSCIDSKLYLNLEDLIDDMPAVAGNEKVQVALNYVRKYRSNDTGELWCLPTSVGTSGTSSTHVSRHRVFTYWDYFYGTYKDQGAPTVTDIYQLSDIMKEMLAKYPEAADGTKTYGCMFHYGYSNNYEYSVYAYYNLYGYVLDHLYYMIETDCWNVTYKSILEDDSKYYEACKWINSLYRDGLMDPDSINYSYSDTTARGPAGYYMMWFPTTNTTDIDSVKTVYCDFQKAYYSRNSNFGSSNIYVGISSKTEHLDACLVLLNSFATPDDLLVYRNGSEGEHWIRNSAGGLDPVDVYVEHLRSGQNADSFPWSDGRTYQVNQYSYIVGLGEYTSYGDGQTYIADETKWTILSDIVRGERDEQWTEMYGYDYIQPMLADKGQIIFSAGTDDIANFCTDPSDEQKLVLDSCAAIIIEASWKMFYCTSDSEFEALWEGMKADCLELGAQDVIDWRMSQIENATKLKAELVG